MDGARPHTEQAQRGPERAEDQDQQDQDHERERGARPGDAVGCAPHAAEDCAPPHARRERPPEIRAGHGVRDSLRLAAAADAAAQEPQPGRARLRSVSDPHAEPLRPARLVRWDGDAGASAEDTVACEEPLEIRLDAGSPVAVIMRTPGRDEELALGFL